MVGCSVCAVQRSEFEGSCIERGENEISMMASRTGNESEPKAVTSAYKKINVKCERDRETVRERHTSRESANHTATFSGNENQQT